MKTLKSFLQKLDRCLCLFSVCVLIVLLHIPVLLTEHFEPNSYHMLDAIMRTSFILFIDMISIYIFLDFLRYCFTRKLSKPYNPLVKVFAFLLAEKTVKIYSHDESTLIKHPSIASEFYAADLAGHVLMATLLKIPFTIINSDTPHCKISFQFPDGIHEQLQEYCLIHYAGLTARQMLFADICATKTAWSLENCMDNPVYLKDPHTSTHGHVISSYFASSLPGLIKEGGSFENPEGEIAKLSSLIYNNAFMLLLENKESLQSLYRFFRSEANRNKIDKWLTKNRNLIIYPLIGNTKITPGSNCYKIF